MQNKLKSREFTIVTPRKTPVVRIRTWGPDPGGGYRIRVEVEQLKIRKKWIGVSNQNQVKRDKSTGLSRLSVDQHDADHHQGQCGQQRGCSGFTQ